MEPPSYNAPENVIFCNHIDQGGALKAVKSKRGYSSVNFLQD